MKHGILKRVIALCITGGVMALALAACGDSENKDEGEGTVQDATQEDEDGTVGVTENEETVIADSSGNDVRVAHASSSGSSGNGFAIPVFKPGEEPDPGKELQPGEEPKPSEGTQSSTGTQKPQQSQSNTGGQPSTGSQQPQQPQQPQPSAGAQPGAGTQQPQQPSTGNQTVHTHNWVTETVHHDATGHYESRVTGTKQVIIGYDRGNEIARCSICGQEFGKATNGGITAAGNHLESQHGKSNLGLDTFSYIEITAPPIYGTEEIKENVWVVDSQAWDENITTCSTCGAKQ